ncbi:phosphopantetheinyl transferase [Thaumarchaeota archaeon SCGC AB-539-E09]|nr:phosphopantetheinyl transferase [Thaumarchaeota archaeon SCGC AB-539-E09]
MINVHDITWNSPSNSLKRLKKEIHVWKIDLKKQKKIFNEMYSILSEKERTRVKSLRFKKDRIRYTIGQSALRNILAEYLELGPEEVCFSYMSTGKPKLESQKKIQFNFSHSKDLAIFALNEKHRLGIDIEFEKEISELEKMIKYYCTNQEKATIKKLPNEKQKSAFYRFWTQKEAYLKGVEYGLKYPLNIVDINMYLRNSPVLNGELKGNKNTNWSIISFRPEPDYMASLFFNYNKKKIFFYNY